MAHYGTLICGIMVLVKNKPFRKLGGFYFWVRNASMIGQGRETGSEIVHCAGTAGSQENLLGGAG